MITSRRTRLHRVPDLAAFRSTIADWILDLPLAEAGGAFVLVPTRAAAEQLRRTVEDRGLRGSRPALAWPFIGPRQDLYDEIAARLTPAPTLLAPTEREVILAAKARQISDAGVAPPFQMRPGLVAEMLALYDQIRRLGRTVGDFERNFFDELEREQETDRGAARLLQQTKFLAATFRAYEQHLALAGCGDEHGLRQHALAVALERPVARVVVTVGDRIADPDGLWPADFDLLTRLPNLQELEIVCTEAVLASGYLERLHTALPDLDEVRSHQVRHARPTLVAGRAADASSADQLFLMHRDREEELIAVARRLKSERVSVGAAPLHRTALVVRRPLPYLYLARDVFADALIPFEALDTLPLASEPYAAVVDLALDAVAAEFTRTSLLALLRSPHVRLAAVADEEAPADEATAVSLMALDHALADARYLGGLDRLLALVEQWSANSATGSREERRRQLALPAARAALRAAQTLRPLADERLMTAQLSTLIDWLRRFDRTADDGDDLQVRRARVRAAVLGVLSALEHAYERHDPEARGDVVVLTALVKRWLGSRTFAARTGQTGLQIVDAQSARYGDFDDVQLVGLIDGEWPERVRRNVLYPASLMSLLEPLPAIADPGRRDRDALQSARAAFKDLLGSAAFTVRLSTFALENDAVVEPSILLEDVAQLALVTERRDVSAVRASRSDGLALEPRCAAGLEGSAARWAAARLADEERPSDAFRGDIGPWNLPRVSVSRLERYLDCPFRFFGSEVLQLEEQPDDEDTRTPLERGRFLHELWERFFSEWQRRGHGRIEPDQLNEAREVFDSLCETALADLSPAEAALERNRLLGSAVSPGIAYRVFAMEADRSTPITERLLEYPLQGEFTFKSSSHEPRTVKLSAKADRIDLLADGTLRVVDYKSKKTPDLKQALQLPIYSLCARDSLRAHRVDQAWKIGEALYLSFEGEKAVVPLRARGRTLDELLDDAQGRLVTALDDIARGRFPPSPAKRSLCGPCPYRAVCRLEIVERTESNGS